MGTAGRSVRARLRDVIAAADPGLLRLYGVIGVAFLCSALARFAIVRETPAGILDRLREALRARLARLVSAQLALLDAGPDEVDGALEDVATAPPACTRRP